VVESLPQSAVIFHRAALPLRRWVGGGIFG
jgi:hypothetical protein